MDALIGSEEYSEEDFAAMQVMHDRHVQKLDAAASTGAAARNWLNTPFGQAVRKVISTNKIYYADACVKLKDADLDEAQKEYKVWESVENVFATIIAEGDEAIRELTVKGSENG